MSERSTMAEKIERIKRLDALVRRKGTGRPQECARKFGISKRHLYRLIDEMKVNGAPIVYDESIGSYVYTQKVDFKFGFEPID